MPQLYASVLLPGSSSAAPLDAVALLQPAEAEPVSALAAKLGLTPRPLISVLYPAAGVDPKAAAAAKVTPAPSPCYST